MRHDKAKEAVKAAQRFIDMVKHAQAEDAKALRYDTQANDFKPRGFSENFDGPSIHVAAVKRASLDLTRALAELRKRENQ